MLLSEGHVHARQYPIAVVWSEARIIRQRNNTTMITETLLMQAVLGAALSKEGGRYLKELIEKVADGD